MTTQTSALDELLKLNGVVAAGEFRPDGALVEFRANTSMTPELAAMSAQFCSSVTQLFNTLGLAFDKLSGMSWAPQRGWAYSGGQYTVCVGGNRGLFVETGKADFNQLFAALSGPR